VIGFSDRHEQWHEDSLGQVQGSRHRAHAETCCRAIRSIPAYVITYGNSPELVSDTNNDSEKMVARLNKMKPGGGAALYDAILHGLHQPQDGAGASRSNRARVLIIIGDGHDTSSKKNPAGGRRDRPAQYGDGCTP